MGKGILERWQQRPLYRISVSARRCRFILRLAFDEGSQPSQSLVPLARYVIQVTLCAIDGANLEFVSTFSPDPYVTNQTRVLQHR